MTIFLNLVLNTDHSDEAQRYAKTAAQGSPYARNLSTIRCNNGHYPTLYFNSEVTITMRSIFISLLLLSACVTRAQSKQSLVVYFDFDKYSLTGRAKFEVDSFLSANKSTTPLTIELSGHTDFVGSDAYNEVLSTLRVRTIADLVRTYLPEDGSVIHIESHGEKLPLNDNQTAAKRQLNRRVEITLLKEGNSIVQPTPSPQPAPDTSMGLKQRIADTTTVSGTNIVLRNITFYGGMHRLMPESRPMLQELLDAMKTYPKLVIEIQGHICCENRAGDGMDLETGVYNLSLARAKAIYEYLVENGIESTRVGYKGFGHSQPLYPWPEQSEEERTANRRVEIRIVSK